MIKNIGIPAVALVIGAVVGALVVQVRLVPLVDQANLARSKAETEAQQANHNSESLVQRLKRTESQNSSLTAQVQSLQTEIAAMNVANGATQNGSGKPLVETSNDASKKHPATGNPQPQSQNERPRRAIESPDQIQTGLQNYLNGEIAKTTDPNVSHGLTVFGNSLLRQMALVQQLRTAKTAEDRETIHQTIRRLRHSTRALVRDQQNYLLRHLAAQYGITSQDRQDQFIQGLRTLEAGPFFALQGGITTARGGAAQ